MIKRLSAALLVLGAVVVIAAPSRAASDGKDDHPPIACIKTGQACTGYGCCSQNCVQSRCRP